MLLSRDQVSVTVKCDMEWQKVQARNIIATIEGTDPRLKNQRVVIQGYYDYLTADAFLAIARQSVATVDDQLRVMQVRYDEGGALKSDLLSLRVRRAEAQEEEVRSRSRRPRLSSPGKTSSTWGISGGRNWWKESCILWRQQDTSMVFRKIVLGVCSVNTPIDREPVRS